MAEPSSLFDTASSSTNLRTTHDHGDDTREQQVKKNASLPHDVQKLQQQQQQPQLGLASTSGIQLHNDKKITFLEIVGQDSGSALHDAIQQVDPQLNPAQDETSVLFLGVVVFLVCVVPIFFVSRYCRGKLVSSVTVQNLVQKLVSLGAGSSPSVLFVKRRASNLESEASVMELKKTPRRPYQPKMLSPPPGNNTSISAAFRSVLSPADVANIAPHLPTVLTMKDWRLIYATELHGYSLHTAYRRAQNMGAFLLVAMDTNRHVFGAFCNESLQMNGPTYYGSGECFVVSIHPTFQIFPWKPSKYMQCVIGTEQFLGFGGSGVGFALWLDANFDRGSSESNPTFGNNPLASTEIFKCVAVEIWGFASPSFGSSLRRSAFNTVTSVVGKLARTTSSSSGFGVAGSSSSSSTTTT